MKIVSAQAAPLRLTLRRPVVTAHGTLRVREGFRVALCDGDPPQNKPGNPRRLTYALARRRGEALASVFVSLLADMSPVVSNNVIAGNIGIGGGDSSARGGGLYVFVDGASTGRLTIENDTYEENQAEQGQLRNRASPIRNQEGFRRDRRADNGSGHEEVGRRKAGQHSGSRVGELLFDHQAYYHSEHQVGERGRCHGLTQLLRNRLVG